MNCKLICLFFYLLAFTLNELHATSKNGGDWEKKTSSFSPIKKIQELLKKETKPDELSKSSSFPQKNLNVPTANDFLISGLKEEENSNPEKAITSFTKAFEGGISKAAIRLGYLYQRQKNFLLSALWFEKALEKHEEEAFKCLDFLAKLHRDSRFIVAKILYKRKKYPEALQLFLMEVYEYWKGFNAISKKTLNGINKYTDITEIPDEVAKELEGNRDAFEKQAKQENPEIYFYIGETYSKGFGVKKDKEKGRKWYKRSADKYLPGKIAYALSLLNSKAPDYESAIAFLKEFADEPIASFVLGWIYKNAPKNIQDHTKSYVYYTESTASKENKYILFQLGLTYEDGKVVTKNDKLAFFFYKKAAKYKLPEAFYKLSLMCLNGIGTTKDFDEALVLLKEAASLGHIEAQYKLGVHLLGPWGNKEEAETWLLKASSNGQHLKAQDKLAQLYTKKEESEKSKTWHEIAAQRGCIRSIIYVTEKDLGSKFKHALSLLEEDKYEEAINKLKNSNVEDQKAAALILGWLYRNGPQSIRDLKISLECFLIAKDDPLSYWPLSIAYKMGEGVGKYPNLAFQYAINAYGVSKGAMPPEIPYQLGWMYLNGFGTTQDETKGLAHLQESADKGYTPAQYDLSIWYFKHDKYANGMLMLRNAALGNHVKAQEKLASLSFKEENYDDAIDWWNKAAEQENFKSLVSLYHFQ